MSDENTLVLPDVPIPDVTAMPEQVAGGIEHFVHWLVGFVEALGYPGILIMTFLESTFVPIPAELTMIPAGYLVQQGEMNLFVVLFCSIVGTVAGSLFNYYIAYHYGRRFMYAYGKYFLFSHEKMDKLDKFFAEHGEISIFTGRLIPGLRHFISFPAGLAHMDVKKFCFYTAAGGAIWMAVLVAVGYIIGGNEELVHRYMPYITTAALALVVLMVGMYLRRQRRKRKGDRDGMAR